jgi:hypothetical protein
MSVFRYFTDMLNSFSVRIVSTSLSDIKQLSHNKLHSQTQNMRIWNSVHYNRRKDEKSITPQSPYIFIWSDSIGVLISFWKPSVIAAVLNNFLENWTRPIRKVKEQLSQNIRYRPFLVLLISVSRNCASGDWRRLKNIYAPQQVLLVKQCSLKIK